MSFNPETHIKGADGRVYERKIVAASFVAVGLREEGQTASSVAVEAAMSKAAADAHAEGTTAPEEIKARMLGARESLLGSSHG